MIFRVEGRAPMNPEKNPQKERKVTNNKLFLYVTAESGIAHRATGVRATSAP